MTEPRHITADIFGPNGVHETAIIDTQTGQSVVSGDVPSDIGDFLGAMTRAMSRFDDEGNLIDTEGLTDEQIAAYRAATE